MNSPRPVRWFWSSATALGAVALLAGCATYRLGSSLPPGIRSVAVPMFVNRTAKPELAAEAVNATVQEFQRDGSLRVAATDAADAVLEVVLTGYRLSPVRYEDERRTTAQEYRITLTADAVLRQRTTGAVVFEGRNLAEDTTFEAAGDLLSAERAALPAAARNLARDIVERALATW
jgi:hypothetical protein